jgi:hypothetical protein
MIVTKTCIVHKPDRFHLKPASNTGLYRVLYHRAVKKTIFGERSLEISAKQPNGSKNHKGAEGAQREEKE